MVRFICRVTLLCGAAGWIHLLISYDVCSVQIWIVCGGGEVGENRQTGRTGEGQRN